MRCSSMSCSTRAGRTSRWRATSSPRSKKTSSSDSTPQPRGDISMPSEKQIVDTFEKIASEIPGYMAASLVDLESGMTLGLKSMRPDFDLAAASAYNSEMVKQKMKIMKALNLKTTLEDMLMTLGDQIHVIKMVNATTFIYMCVDRAMSNLAIVRNVLNKHATSFA